MTTTPAPTTTTPTPTPTPCTHGTVYWINRARRNWRCTDCGYQYFGAVAAARRQAQRVQREEDTPHGPTT